MKFEITLNDTLTSEISTVESVAASVYTIISDVIGGEGQGQTVDAIEVVLTTTAAQRIVADFAALTRRVMAAIEGGLKASRMPRDPADFIRLRAREVMGALRDELAAHLKDRALH